MSHLTNKFLKKVKPGTITTTTITATPASGITASGITASGIAVSGNTSPYAATTFIPGSNIGTITGQGTQTISTPLPSTSWSSATATWPIPATAEDVQRLEARLTKLEEEMRELWGSALEQLQEVLLGIRGLSKTYCKTCGIEVERGGLHLCLHHLGEEQHKKAFAELDR